MRTPTKIAVVVGASGALLAGGIVSANAAIEPSIRVVGLTTDGAITSIDTGRERASTPKTLRGLASSDRPVAIDYRPATNKLFGIAKARGNQVKVFKISPATGRVYNPKFLVGENGQRLTTRATTFAIDFNPTVDRLRIVTPEGDNWRADVRNGTTLVDGRLGWASGDRNRSRGPRVAAAAYTNSVAGASETVLFDLEARSNSLVRQAPPNDGVLNTVTRVARDVRGSTGFDIVTAGGRERAVMSNTSRGQTKIYQLDLSNGKVRATAEIGNRALRDIAAPTGR